MSDSIFPRVVPGMSQSMQSAAEQRIQLEQLRAVLLRLVYCHVRGEELPLHEEPLRSFLDLPQDVTAEAALQRLMRSQARVLGATSCKACGAQVQDLEGITDEDCPWCGAKVETES